MNLTAGTRRLRLAVVIGVAVLTTATATAVTAASAAAAGAATPGITDADVVRAELGVLAFNVRNLSADPITEPCPVLRQDQLGWYLVHYGFTPNFTGFGVDTYYNRDVGEGYPGVDCLVDLDGAVNPDPAAPHYPVVGAAYLPAGTTFEQYLANIEGHTLLTPSVPGIGGQVGGGCIPRFCYLHWHRGSLVINALVAGGTGDITQAQTEAMLIAMVPDVVTNLIASLDSGMTATSSTVPAPTTTAIPTTVAVPTTVAAPTTAFPPPPTVATPTTQPLPPVSLPPPSVPTKTAR